MPRREQPDDEAAERVADQHIWTRNARVLQQQMQFVGDALRGSRQRACLAPTEPGAIVAAALRDRGHCRLSDAPAERRRAQRRVEDHRGCAGADAVQVQPVCANTDESAG
jgi:hypothetical protein